MIRIEHLDEDYKRHSQSVPAPIAAARAIKESTASRGVAMMIGLYYLSSEGPVGVAVLNPDEHLSDTLYSAMFPVAVCPEIVGLVMVADVGLSERDGLLVTQCDNGKISSVEFHPYTQADQSVSWGKPEPLRPELDGPMGRMITEAFNLRIGNIRPEIAFAALMAKGIQATAIKETAHEADTDFDV